jgi:hypothetical protein
MTWTPVPEAAVYKHHYPSRSENHVRPTRQFGVDSIAKSLRPESPPDRDLGRSVASPYSRHAAAPLLSGHHVRHELIPLPYAGKVYASCRPQNRARGRLSSRADGQEAAEPHSPLAYTAPSGCLRRNSRPGTSEVSPPPARLDSGIATGRSECRSATRRRKADPLPGVHRGGRRAGDDRRLIRMTLRRGGGRGYPGVCKLACQDRMSRCNAICLARGCSRAQ